METVLNNIQEENANIFVEYIDPFDTEDSRELVMQEMQQFGLIPRTAVSDNNQSVDQTVVFPWAIISDGNKSFVYRYGKKLLVMKSEMYSFDPFQNWSFNFWTVSNN